MQEITQHTKKVKEIIEKYNKQLDVHRTHTPRCEVKKIIALWRMQRLGDMIIDQCKDKVPAKLTSYELLLSVR